MFSYNPHSLNARAQSPDINALSEVEMHSCESYLFSEWCPAANPDFYSLSNTAKVGPACKFMEANRAL